MAEIEDSILLTTKKMLGLDADYTEFDLDIILHINSVFSTLQQLGIGPDEGFAITDGTTKWAEYVGVYKAINSVKSYMFMKVKLLFDPPATSFTLESYNKMATEYEWRLNAHMEGVRHPWPPPTTS